MLGIKIITGSVIVFAVYKYAGKTISEKISLLLASSLMVWTVYTFILRLIDTSIHKLHLNYWGG